MVSPHFQTSSAAFLYNMSDEDISSHGTGLDTQSDHDGNQGRSDYLSCNESDSFKAVDSENSDDDEWVYNINDKQDISDPNRLNNNNHQQSQKNIDLLNRPSQSTFNLSLIHI